MGYAGYGWDFWIGLKLARCLSLPISLQMALIMLRLSPNIPVSNFGMRFSPNQICIGNRHAGYDEDWAEWTSIKTNKMWMMVQCCHKNHPIGSGLT